MDFRKEPKRKMQIANSLKRLAAALTVALVLAGCTVAKPAEKKDEAAAPATEAKPADQAAPAQPAEEAPPKPRSPEAEQAIVDAAAKAGKAISHTDAVVVEQVATVILEVTGEGTANKAAYKTRLLDMVRTVANAAMKAPNVSKVHVTAQSDGSHGTPNGDFAVTVFFQKDKMKTAGAWGNLISNDQMLLEAPLQTVHKDLN